MPGAVLRVEGSKAGVAQFLSRTSWSPLVVFWKGAPRFHGSKRVSTTNGFNISVSSSSGLDFPAQVRDVTKFLRRHRAEVRRLRRLRLLSVVDFGVNVRDKHIFASFRFPLATIDELAKCGVALEVTYYGEVSE